MEVARDCALGRLTRADEALSTGCRFTTLNCLCIQPLSPGLDSHLVEHGGVFGVERWSLGAPHS